MRERLSAILSARAFTVVAALVLIVGVVAFATVRLGGDGEAESAAPDTTTAPAPDDFNPTVTEPALSPVTSEARVAAGEFILAAAGREDLPKAWKLTHPELRAQCGCSYKEWLTGNIPVQYYPTGNLDGAAFAVDESSPRRVVLEVVLTAKAGEDVPPQSFFIGLKAVGKGTKLSWLVDYWAPSGSPPVPQSG